MKYVFISSHARRELEEMSDRLDSLRRVYESDLKTAAEYHGIDSQDYLYSLLDIADTLRGFARMKVAK